MCCLYAQFQLVIADDISGTIRGYTFEEEI